MLVSCGRRFGKTDFGLDEAIDGPKGLLEGYRWAAHQLYAHRGRRLPARPDAPA